MVNLYIILTCIFPCFQFPVKDSIAYKKEDSIVEVGRWVVEKMPIYQVNESKGYLISILPMLSNYVKFPLSNSDSITMRVWIQFYVEKTGEITDIKIVKGIRRDLDEEAIRVVKMLKCIRSAYIRGKPVKYQETIPIVFKY